MPKVKPLEMCQTGSIDLTIDQLIPQHVCASLNPDYNCMEEHTPVVVPLTDQIQQQLLKQLQAKSEALSLVHYISVMSS